MMYLAKNGGRCRTIGPKNGDIEGPAFCVPIRLSAFNLSQRRNLSVFHQEQSQRGWGKTLHSYESAGENCGDLSAPDNPAGAFSFSSPERTTFASAANLL